MTKQEIKAIIAAKIEGQGSAVDVGGGLPAILNGIIDLIPEPSPGPGPVEPLFVQGSREDLDDYIAFSPDTIEFNFALQEYLNGRSVMFEWGEERIQVISAHLAEEPGVDPGVMIGFDTSGEKWVWSEEVAEEPGGDEPEPEEPEE